MFGFGYPFTQGPLATPWPEDIQKLHSWALEMLFIINRDRGVMKLAQDYYDGEHDDPYMPDVYTREYETLVERSKTNIMKLVVAAPTQQLYVDSFRAGDSDTEHESAAWGHWQRSSLDARQHPLYRSAFKFGHGYTLTERRDNGKAYTKLLASRATAAIYEDPANDIVPAYALSIIRRERLVEDENGGKKVQPGFAYMWDDTNVYGVEFLNFGEVTSVVKLGAHGASSCPVTRFPCEMDDEGNTEGLILPLKPIQDRLNQTILDLLVAQSGGSFKVRTVSGMAPPIQQRPVWLKDADGNYELDENGKRIVDYFEDVTDEEGRPVAQPVNLNASRLLYAEDPEVKFGQLDETALDGYISAIDLAFRHLSVVTQMPPDYVLGQIANLSADALDAAERSLSRKISAIQTVFGESWERVFRLAAEFEGDVTAAQDDSAEVVWRDIDNSSMSRIADALGKLHDNVGAPSEGLWELIPGMTRQRIERWKQFKVDDDPQVQLAAAIERAAPNQVLGGFSDGNTVEQTA